MRSSSEQSRKRSPQEKRTTEVQNDDKSSCLYVGNIDRRIDSNQLTEIFKKCGEIQYCDIVFQPISDRDSKEVRISRGYGFVKFTKMDDMVKAKNELDGYQINGRKIKVQISKRNKPRDSTPGRYLGRKRNSPIHHHRPRHSAQRSSSYSHRERRRHHQRKQKHHRRRQRSRDSRDRDRDRDRQRHNRHRDRDIDRSRDKNGEYHRRKRSSSDQNERRRGRQ